MEGGAVRTGEAGAALAELLADYRPVAGAYDEMLRPGGSVRAHYAPLMEALAAIGPAERDERFRSAAQYLREAGVFYRIHAEGEDPAGGVSAWPLAHPPLVIDPAEWRRLEAGLVQRARYLEALVGDLYGARRLVQDGVLPAPILAQNPEFLRPLADQGLSGAPLVRFVAIDLARAPDGRWQVVADRTQAPSGAGFALENRVATGKAFPDLLRRHPVQRLAGFFQAFRETLSALNSAEFGRVGLLSPGPLSETYFEHAYLARYFGFRLLEGGDLSVRDDAVAVRTVDGPSPIRVLWRRLDADFADPLELRADSRIGTPGLLRAVRAGTLHLVNALGSGILETPALRAFEAEAARALLGEDLALASIPTRWPEPSRGLDAVDSDPVRLSFAPTFVKGRLEPRAVSLRVFLARGEDGWSAMPGGFARLSDTAGAASVAMRDGGRSADVWIAGGDEAGKPLTLIARPGGPFQRRLPGALPSRAADDLYWLGRYVERVEVAARLFRMQAERLARAEPPGVVERRIASLLAELTAAASGSAVRAGLKTLADGAFAIASHNRERFSPDGWRVLAEIVELLKNTGPDAVPLNDEALASALLTRLSGFTGLVRENMYQFSGWRFLEAGRRLERGLMTAHVSGALLRHVSQEDGVCEALLEFCDSRMTYRRRFSVDLQTATVLDLCVLDPLNPRSVAFQTNALKAILDALPGVRAGESLDPAARRAARLCVRLQTAEAAEVDPAFLARVARDLSDISNLLAERFFGQTGTVEASQTHE